MIVSTHPQNRNELSFGVWMLGRRQDTAMTRRELANKIGVSSEFVRAIEMGKRLPSVRTAVSIFKALDVEYEIDKNDPSRFYFDFDSVVKVLTHTSGRTTNQSKPEPSRRKTAPKSRKRCCHI